MKKFTVVSRDDEESVLISKDLQKRLFSGGLCIDDRNPDIVCFVGGDGTFLSAVHKYIRRLDTTVFAGINTGTLGFFTDYTHDEIEKFANDILTSEPEVEKKRLLKIDIMGEDTRSYLAVNEMRIENVIKTQTIDVFINDKKLETYRGTGLCVSTQAGSTAYNRSLKGAVVEVGLEVMELTEITGIHHIHYRSLGVPLILAANNRIRLESDYDETSLLCFDRYALNLKGVKAVECTLSDRQVKLAHYRPTEYIEHLYHLF